MKKHAPSADLSDKGIAANDFLTWSEKKEAVILVMNWEQAWAAMQAIQMATSAAPEQMGPLLPYAIEVGEMAQRLLSKTPALAKMAAAGWPQKDDGKPD